MGYTPLPRVTRDYAEHHRLLGGGSVRVWEGVYRYDWMSPQQLAESARAAVAGGADAAAFFRCDYLRDADWPALAKL
jgi:hypothetical protein